MNEMTIALWVK